MFNLDQAIAEWLRQMAASGLQSAEVLDELESHLRDAIEEQRRAGLNASKAFEASVHRFGQPASLRIEFAKAGLTKNPLLRRLKRVLFKSLGVTLPHPTALTTSAWETLDLGREEARGFHHDFIGTEHVLLGLLELKASGVPVLLREMGIESKIVRAEIEKLIGNGPDGRADHPLPYTPRVRKALELARAEASALNQTHIGTEHLFLGLLREGGGVAALVLKTLGVDIRTAREQVLKRVGRNQPGV